MPVTCSKAPLVAARAAPLKAGKVFPGIPSVPFRPVILLAKHDGSER